MSDKLLELYVNKFLKGKLDFYGITLFPKLVEKDGETIVTWEMENPIDLPFYFIPIIERLKDSFDGFYQLLGQKKSKTNEEFINVFKKKIRHFNFPQKYIPKRVNNELDSHVGEKIQSSYSGVEFEFKIRGYDLFMSDDMVEVYIDVDIIKARETFSGHELSYDNIYKFLDKLARRGDILELNDIVSQPFDDDLLKYPTLIDRYEMYLSNQVTYFYDGIKMT